MQRLAKFAKKAEAVAPNFASVSAADIIRAPVVQQAIPLEFAPLLAPYKRRGRLSLRVEDMPQQARLSAGRNNGDGSWSLASDELDGLSYLIPENLVREHTLSVRIMAFEEGAASTLKLVVFPVPLQPAAIEEGDVVSADSPDPILHHELNRMQSLFAVRDSELAQLRAALEQAKTAKDAELTDARAAWESELQERLSEAVAQAKSAWEKNAGRKAQDSRAAQAKARGEQQIAEDRWQEAEQRLETEHQRWKAESDAELSAAIAQERARWQVQTEQRVEAECQRWKAESAGAMSEALAEERKRWQAQVEQRIETERQRWEADSAGGLSAAVAQEQERWQVRTEQRVEAERQRWKAESAGELSVAVAKEQQRCQAQTDRRIETEYERWKAESLRLLSDAETRWKTEEAERSAAALAEWREQSSRMLAEASQKCRELELALAEARARSKAAVPDTGDSGALRAELATTRSILAERDGELAEHRAAFERDRERWQQDLDASLTTAARAWKVDEDARLAAMVARSRAQADAALAAATSRFEAAERALAENQGAAPSARDDGYVEGLRREVSTLQAALVNREVELGRVKGILERSRLLPVQGVVSNPVLARNIADPDEEVPASSKRGLVRDFVVAVCVIMPVIFFYPRLEIYLP
ncbi:MAG TPA: hypothetical protein VEM35_00165, partial [Rhizomicrobium sp.]|nr:hypothetical protein [Rhizomicrobium sp.]